MRKIFTKKNLTATKVTAYFITVILAIGLIGNAIDIYHSVQGLATVDWSNYTMFYSMLTIAYSCLECEEKKAKEKAMKIAK